MSNLLYKNLETNFFLFKIALNFGNFLFKICACKLSSRELIPITLQSDLLNFV